MATGQSRRYVSAGTRGIGRSNRSGDTKYRVPWQMGRRGSRGSAQWRAKEGLQQGGHIDLASGLSAASLGRKVWKQGDQFRRDLCQS